MPHSQHDLTCAVCGKHFQSDDKNRKRCPECLAEYKRQCEEKRQAKLNKPPKAPKPPRTKICVVCGKEFELRPKDSLAKSPKTCSKECHDKLQPPLQDKACVICGKVFHPKHAKQKCCSPECAAKFNSGEKVARKDKPAQRKKP
ncbi:MAG: hypothetical protein IJP68_05850 [Selenomonadaceae bacterium]|nr:hypothetical protein [Selenomonadaceae bacterium]